MIKDILKVILLVGTATVIFITSKDTHPIQAMTCAAACLIYFDVFDRRWGGTAPVNNKTEKIKETRGKYKDVLPPTAPAYTFVEETYEPIDAKLHLSLEKANHTIRKLELKLSRHKHNITVMQESLHKKNIELDAFQKVWCAGGCKNGVNRYSGEELTQETVDMIVSNTNDLVRYWENYKRRQEK